MQNILRADRTTNSHNNFVSFSKPSIQININQGEKTYTMHCSLTRLIYNICCFW